MYQDAGALNQFMSHSLTFTFSNPLTQFQLYRMGTAQSDNSIPQWQARFYSGSNGGGTLLGSFGEPYTVANLSPTAFTFTPVSETIGSMTLESTWVASTFRNIPTDDWTLTTVDELQVEVVPEPASLTLLGLGCVGLASFARRRRRTTSRAEG